MISTFDGPLREGVVKDLEDWEVFFNHKWLIENLGHPIEPHPARYGAPSTGDAM